MSDKYVASDGTGAGDAIKLGDEPIWEMSYRELLTSIPKRLIALVAKAVGLKMLILVGATVLFLRVDRFPAWAWITVAGFVIFGREFLKVIKDLKK